MCKDPSPGGAYIPVAGGETDKQLSALRSVLEGNKDVEKENVDGSADGETAGSIWWSGWAILRR